jgi:ATP-dependent DNA helicase RecG
MPGMDTTGDISLRLPEGLTANEIKICELIQKDKNLTFNEIAERLGISWSTVKRVVGSLTDKGVIERVGPNKGGSWRFLL